MPKDFLSKFINEIRDDLKIAANIKGFVRMELYTGKGGFETKVMRASEALVKSDTYLSKIVNFELFKDDPRRRKK
jgi:hypothetical protein